MNPLIDEVLTALGEVGWHVKLRDRPAPLPADFAARYPQLPPLAVEFLTHVASCVDPDEGAWLLAHEDLVRTDGWRWDEYERIVAEEWDPPYAERARTYWNSHLPLYLLVDGDYEFLALVADPASKHSGKVVWGELAGFDEGDVVESSSYEEFLAQLRDAARRPPTQSNAQRYGLTRFVHREIVADATAWGRFTSWLRTRLTR